MPDLLIGSATILILAAAAYLLDRRRPLPPRLVWWFELAACALLAFVVFTMVLDVFSSVLNAMISLGRGFAPPAAPKPPG